MSDERVLPMLLGSVPVGCLADEPLYVSQEMFMKLSVKFDDGV